MPEMGGLVAPPDVRAAPPADWREVAFADVAEVVGGGTPSTKVPENFDGEIPWLTPKDLSGTHERYIDRGERSLSQRGLDSSSAKLLPKGSVLLSTRAPIGYVALAKNPIATNQGFRSLVVRDGAVPEYLYYWLKLNTEELERHASGSTFRELSGSSLKEIRLRLPPLEDQSAIARVLGALDDKIELNRRLSETLEEMARALFRSWFVDFDPVRAKAGGRPSGVPPDLDALFPASFEASELGEIPAGWEVKTLGDVICRSQSHACTILVEGGLGNGMLEQGLALSTSGPHVAAIFATGVHVRHSLYSTRLCHGSSHRMHARSHSGRHGRGVRRASSRGRAIPAYGAQSASSCECCARSDRHGHPEHSCST